VGAILRRLSVPFDTANDGIEAIEQICKTRYDLVLMDLSMPRVRSRPKRIDSVGTD